MDEAPAGAACKRREGVSGRGRHRHHWAELGRGMIRLRSRDQRITGSILSSIHFATADTA